MNDISEKRIKEEIERAIACYISYLGISQKDTEIITHKEYLKYKENNSEENNPWALYGLEE